MPVSRALSGRYSSTIGWKSVTLSIVTLIRLFTSDKVQSGPVHVSVVENSFSPQVPDGYVPETSTPFTVFPSFNSCAPSTESEKAGTDIDSGVPQVEVGNTMLCALTVASRH